MRMFLAFALTLACAGRSIPEEVEDTLMVAVMCGSGSGSGSDGPQMQLGTAVTISGDRAITALHVVTCDDGSVPNIGVYSGQPGRGVLPAFVEVVLPRLDTARIVIPDGDLPISPVSVGPRPNVGDGDLTVITAVPLWQVKHCVVQPDQDMGQDPALPKGAAPLTYGELRILVGCDIEPGNSGGAAYDSSGRLVGLVTWTERRSEFAALVPLQTVPWITRAP